jgi:UDP-N-acetylglucosamine 2-epimerase (non-hydrolysing)
MLSLIEIGQEYKVIFSVHPRTKQTIQTGNFISYSKFSELNIYMHEPFGFFDFINLETYAQLIITDSGTVQEEACIIGTPCIIIRESTERNETIECGASILTGINYINILNAFNYFKKTSEQKYIDWKRPDDYIIDNVSDIVINILMGK